MWAGQILCSSVYIFIILPCDKGTNEKNIIVSGGKSNEGQLSSTELLINGEWTEGPPLPVAMRGQQMVINDADVYVLGGYQSQIGYLDSVYKLTCSSGKCGNWTLHKTLKNRRALFAVVPLSSYSSDCSTIPTTITTTTTTTTTTTKTTG